MTMQGQGKSQERPEKTLSLHIRLILGTEVAYNNFKKKQKTIFLKDQQTLGKRENLISGVTTLLNSNV